MKKLLALLLLWSPLALGLDVNGQLKRAQLETQSSDPTGSAARIYYNTGDATFRYYNGAWRTIVDTSTALSNPMTTQGDIIYENVTPAAARLAKGTATTVLHSGNTPSWSAIVNADVDAAAAIAYTKLNLGTSITDTDIYGSAAIQGSKIATATTALFGVVKKPQGELYYTGGGALGTLPNKIVHYTTATVSTGTSVITYAGSSVNGDTFTVGEAGIYSATMVALNGGGNSTCGISNNDSSVTSTVDSITVATRLTYGSGPGAATCSVVFHAAANDVIRAHLNDTTSTNSGAASFRIIQLSKD